MGSQLYKINKGVNKSIEFKGLKAQYIWWLAGCLVALMMLFALLYVVGVNAYLCLVVIMSLGGFLISKIYSLSKRYGEHGMMKKLASRNIPRVVRENSRKLFMKGSITQKHQA